MTTTLVHVLGFLSLIWNNGPWRWRKLYQDAYHHNNHPLSFIFDWGESAIKKGEGEIVRWNAFSKLIKVRLLFLLKCDTRQCRHLLGILISTDKMGTCVSCLACCARNIISLHNFLFLIFFAEGKSVRLVFFILKSLLSSASFQV